MREALALAAQAASAGEIPVGAVLIAPDGETVIGRGANVRETLNDPAGHAEIVALRQGAAHTGHWRLEDTTLVVTLEPCAMCAGAIQQARVKRVVFGAWEPKTGAAGSQRDILRDQRANHVCEVIPGVLENQCQEILREFFSGRRK